MIVDLELSVEEPIQVLCMKSAKLQDLKAMPHKKQLQQTALKLFRH